MNKEKFGIHGWKMNNKFIIFSAGYNCFDYIEKHIKSIQNQTYKNYTHIIIDDASTDGTFEKGCKYIDDNTIIYRNNNNIKWIRNALKYLDDHIINEEDIIVIVDLDDWLPHKKVLEIVNNCYNKTDCWMTYSRFIDTMSLRLSTWIPVYTDDIIKNKLFRQSVWSFTHLRTFKAFLWNELNAKMILFENNINDLKDNKGEYFKSCYDQAILIPMLEMSSPDHISFIPNALYVYNNSNPLQVEKINRKEQEINRDIIRSKNKYKSLIRG